MKHDRRDLINSRPYCGVDGTSNCSRAQHVVSSGGAGLVDAGVVICSSAFFRSLGTKLRWSRQTLSPLVAWEHLTEQQVSVTRTGGSPMARMR